MINRPKVAVAPNFHLPPAGGGRLLVRDGEAWRSPCDAEGPAVVPREGTREDTTAYALLFGLPGHLRSAFWAMLEGEGAWDFTPFAQELGRFLTFKQLPPPRGAVVEVVLHRAGGVVDPQDLWAALNLGDGPLVVGMPGLRLRLAPGEGCRFPVGVVAEVLPPEAEVPAVLVTVRRPANGPAS